MHAAFRSLMMPLVCFMSHGTWNFKAAYNTIYQAQSRSTLFREIVRQAFGSEFPDGLDCFSFVTLTDLHRMADHLGLEPGQRLADIACGRGGPGMWLARMTGACLRGVDVSDQAVASATLRLPEFGLDTSRARFTTGAFYHTGLDTGSCDGAVSIDAFWVVPDRCRAFAEISRILRPGSRFVFTTWDGNIPFMPKDHRTDLENSGFTIEAYGETPGWKQRQLAVYAGVLNARDDLVREMGNAYAMPIIREARSTPPVLDKSTRVLVCARKT